MKTRLLTLLAASCCGLASAAECTNAATGLSDRSERTTKTVPLFLTGGQSNTDGRLKADTRPDCLLVPNSNALVSAHSPYDRKRLGVFLPFAPASKADGQPGMWAYDAVVYHHLAKAIGTFYVAKTSYGGTSIDPAVNNSPSKIGIAGAVWHPEIGRGYHWSADPSFLAKTAIAGQPFEVNGTNCVGQSLFKAWMANVDAAIDAIKARGDTPDVKAVIWHQGESDRLKVSRSYEKNIKTLIAAIRAHVAEKTGEKRYLALDERRRPRLCHRQRRPDAPARPASFRCAVRRAFRQPALPAARRRRHRQGRAL